MNIAGGAASVQAQALEYDTTPDEVAKAARATAGFFGGRACAGKTTPTATAAAALLSRGVSNPNTAGNACNPDALRLGAEIGSVVIGQEQWERYIKTSAREMNKEDKPTPQPASQTAQRPPGEREGWVFHHVALSVPRWAMTDQITFILPGHTEANPMLHVESLRQAISEAYHEKWMRYSDAGPRTRRTRMLV